MNPFTIREFASSFQKSRILLSGFELDIFTAIEANGTSNHQIASYLHLNEHACERLLNALVSLGFLTKQNHLFFNTKDSFAYRIFERTGTDKHPRRYSVSRRRESLYYPEKKIYTGPRRHTSPGAAPDEVGKIFRLERFARQAAA